MENGNQSQGVAAASTATPAPLLTVKDLRVHYHSTHGDYKVVDGASMSVQPGEIFGLAGESGSGKSTLLDGVLRLIRPPGEVVGGQIHYRPRDAEQALDLLALPPAQLRSIRWSEISYVPQGSMNALNPVMRIREQITEAIRAHADMTADAANQRAAEVLEQVGLGRSVERMYPHELSGGMNQRAVIACAIVLKPRLVLADEPTTALDVNVQRGILQLLGDLRDQQGITVVIVSHEMGVHAELVDRIGIVYAGQVVEIASVNRIFDAPLHPYTQGLIESIPRVGGDRRRLSGIPGMAPSSLVWPSGCRFHPRCPQRLDICASTAPVTVEFSPGHLVSCHLYGASAHVNTAPA
jgi:peptide/nickel transport system ATP-binding protein